MVIAACSSSIIIAARSRFMNIAACSRVMNIAACIIIMIIITVIIFYEFIEWSFEPELKARAREIKEGVDIFRLCMLLSCILLTDRHKKAKPRC
jgi:hypothetical protein